MRICCEFCCEIYFWNCCEIHTVSSWPYDKHLAVVQLVDFTFLVLIILDLISILFWNSLVAATEFSTDHSEIYCRWFGDSPQIVLFWNFLFITQGFSADHSHVFGGLFLEFPACCFEFPTIVQKFSAENWGIYLWIIVDYSVDYTENTANVIFHLYCKQVAEEQFILENIVLWTVCLVNRHFWWLSKHHYAK